MKHFLTSLSIPVRNVPRLAKTPSNHPPGIQETFGPPNRTTESYIGMVISSYPITFHENDMVIQAALKVLMCLTRIAQCPANLPIMMAKVVHPDLKAYWMAIQFMNIGRLHRLMRSTNIPKFNIAADTIPLTL